MGILVINELDVDIHQEIEVGECMRSEDIIAAEVEYKLRKKDENLIFLVY